MAMVSVSDGVTVVMKKWGVSPSEAALQLRKLQWQNTMHATSLAGFPLNSDP